MIRHILRTLSVAALMTACHSDEPGSYRHMITGESCDPDFDTMQSEDDEPNVDPAYCGNNGHGNNEDGVDSSNPGAGTGGPNGEIDESCDGSGECIDDEIHPQHQDEGCELPVGCDENLCCEDGGEDPGDTGDGEPDGDTDTGDTDGDTDTGDTGDTDTGDTDTGDVE